MSRESPTEASPAVNSSDGMVVNRIGRFEVRAISPDRIVERQQPRPGELVELTGVAVVEERCGGDLGF
jgi:hypothetical protein